MVRMLGTSGLPLLSFMESYKWEGSLFFIIILSLLRAEEVNFEQNWMAGLK